MISTHQLSAYDYATANHDRFLTNFEDLIHISQHQHPARSTPKT